MQTRPLTDSARTRRRTLFPETTVVFSCASLALATLALLAPHMVYADPHAVFYTDTGQKQVFFNVLAALNQADYVEEPGKPPIAHATEVGEAIKSGRLIDTRGNFVQTVPAEGNERVELPRIRVRAVTSDNGDVYFRERMERQALSEQIRVELSIISCDWQRIVLGDAVWAQCEKGAPSPPQR